MTRLRGRDRRGRDPGASSTAGWPAAPRSTGRLAAAGRSTSREHARRAARSWTSAARCSSAARSRPAPSATCGRGARWSSPTCPTCRSTPTARRSTPPAELYDGRRAYAASLDARAYAWSRRPPTPATPARAGAARPRDRRRADRAGVAGRPLVGVMGGHALERGDGGVRRRRPARARCSAGTRRRAPAAGPGRWRPPTSAPTSPATTRDDLRPRRVEPLAAVPVVPPVGRRLGRGGVRRASTGGRTARDSLGHPDLVLRPRAAERRSPPRSRSTSATPSARRSCCSLRRRDRVPARAPAAPCRRSSRTPARTTTPPRPRSRRWCSSGDVLDRDRAGLAAAAVAGPRPGDGAARPPGRHRRRGRRAGRRQ